MILYNGQYVINLAGLDNNVHMLTLCNKPLSVVANKVLFFFKKHGALIFFRFLAGCYIL